MAIVISGVNNNDKITAADGTIDLLSDANLAGTITAPTFSATGNITAGHLNIGSGIQLGNAGVATATTFVGNLTGNVNATSNLLLQIGGSEKFRVGSSGQFGIGGANYGTSGQVLTSGGSGSAATWSTIPTPDADKITEGNTEAEVIDTGSDGHFKVTTEGNERFRIDSSGHLHTGYTSSFGGDHVNILATDGGGISIAQNNSGNATSGTALGTLSFQGYHSGGATFSSAEAKISGVAAANHTGSSAATDMVFFTKPSTTGPGSAPTERVQIKSGGGLVSNKGGGNIAFSDGYSAIEARSPEGTTQLTVTNTTYESGTYDNEAGIWFKGNYSGNNERAKSAIIHKNIGDYGVGGLHFCVDNGYDNQNASYADRKMSITKDGIVSMPFQPMVRYAGSWSYTSWNSHAQVVWGGEQEDIGGNFSNGIFTVPSGGEGVYVISAQFIGPNSGGNFILWSFYKNTTALNPWVQSYSSGGNEDAASSTLAITCSVGDTLRVAFHNSYQYGYQSGYSSFSIFKVH